MDVAAEIADERERAAVFIDLWTEYHRLDPERRGFVDELLLIQRGLQSGDVEGLARCRELIASLMSAFGSRRADAINVMRKRGYPKVP